MPRNFLCPNTNNSIPFRIGSGLSDAGPRLGGKAPLGVFPVDKGAGKEYVCTFPVSKSPDLEVSIFLTTDFETMLRTFEQVLANGEVGEAIEHPPSCRGDSLDCRSQLSPHPLILLPEACDEEADEDLGMIRTPTHKLCGMPYAPTLARQPDFDALNSAHFRLVFQLGFPGGKDAEVHGTWPFADGIFYVFGHASNRIEPWRMIWVR